MAKQTVEFECSIGDTVGLKGTRQIASPGVEPLEGVVTSLSIDEAGTHIVSVRFMDHNQRVHTTFQYKELILAGPDAKPGG